MQLLHGEIKQKKILMNLDNLPIIAAILKRGILPDGTIVIIVRVPRTRSPHEAIIATGKTAYLAERLVANMPRGEGEEKKIIFFKLKRSEYTHDGFTKSDGLEKAYARRSLKPDPIAQLAVNEADPMFADTYPNGSQWTDSEGQKAYIKFRCWSGTRNVEVDTNDEHSWLKGIYFAGVEH